MIKLVLVAVFLMGSSTVYAAETGTQAGIFEMQIAHGGGCRKDSPRGQCCHAGSKPLHCH